VPLRRWAEQIGRTTSTIWRWRKFGWIEVVNIAGKLYISAQEVERFNTRAAAGEFSREPVVPQRVRESVPS
jgi:predicted site-specific integrase-resolvase